MEEAMLVLKLGIKHRKVAATRLNYHSSRSHSIYTVKLVRLANVDKPSSAIINRFGRNNGMDTLLCCSLLGFLLWILLVLSGQLRQGPVESE